MAATKKAATTKAATAKQLASAIVKLASKQAGKQAVSGKSAKASRTSNAQKMLLELMGTGR
jgi:hypothetical protein